MTFGTYVSILDLISIGETGTTLREQLVSENTAVTTDITEATVIIKQFFEDNTTAPTTKIYNEAGNKAIEYSGGNLIIIDYP